jgi:hypothetical protein
MNAYAPLVIHPAPVEELPSPDYTVTINGQPVFVHTARVSAHPMNQTWPGYQRPLEQTELAAFATWDMAAPVEICVTAAQPIREVRVRPSARQIKPVQAGQTLRFTLDRPGQLTVEINGMHQALHLFANPPESAAPDPKDPAVRYFGPGVHCPGVIRVTSGQTIYLAGGAVVYGAILAEKATDITIRGRGILDGSKFSRGDGYTLFSLQSCQRVTIEGLILRDPCGWTLVPVACQQVQIRNIKLIGHWRYNADGIDFVNSQHCLLEDSFIRTFDDCVVFKGCDYWPELACRQLPVQNIQVRRCVLWCDWGRALEIGAETVAPEITALTFEDCDIIHVLDVAMEIQNGDRAHCHNIRFRDIRVELDDDQTHPMYQTEPGQTYVATGRHIAQLLVLVTSNNAWSRDTIRGRVDDIRFEDITVTAGTTPELFFAGLDAEHMVQDVHIINLCINGQRIRSLQEAHCIVRPFVSDLHVT